MFKANNKKTRTTSRSSVFIINFEHIIHLFFSVSTAEVDQANIGWVMFVTK